MRVVFDTNVLVSALLFEHSTPAQALFSAISNREVLISIALINEVHRVLYRPKFDRYITNIIVTGDSDLLVLNPFREIFILNPQTFLENYPSS